jgi:hypothetical protein
MAKGRQRDAAARAVRLEDGELMLLSAIIRQALQDAQSTREHIREDALHFLRNEKAVAYWDSALGLDGRLLKEAARLLAQATTPEQRA